MSRFPDRLLPTAEPPTEEFAVQYTVAHHLSPSLSGFHVSQRNPQFLQLFAKEYNLL